MVHLPAEETNDAHWKFKVILKGNHTTGSPFSVGGRGEGRNKIDYPDEEIIILMSEKIIIWNFSGWFPAGNFN